MGIEPVQFHLKPVETPLFKVGVSYQDGQGAGAAKTQGGFADALSGALKNLKDVHNAAETAMKNYTAGNDVDVSQVMLTMEKSQIATDLAIQVRNKFIEGFNDLIRMQI